MIDYPNGEKTARKLINDVISPFFQNNLLKSFNNSAVLNFGNQRFTFSTSSYSVNPLFFPGGDIGRLAVYGTVNDLSMCGGSPIYISIGFIIGDGFPIDDFRRILESIHDAAVESGVIIVAGDTRVVPEEASERIYIHTSGIGTIHPHITVDDRTAQVGDQIILSGTIAEHGIAVLTQREKMDVDKAAKSDSAPLNHLVKRIFTRSRDIHVMRVPNRGGLSFALSEIATQSGVGIRIAEDLIPIQPSIKIICEKLGIDPLHVAAAGKLIAIVPNRSAEKILNGMQTDPLGKDAAIIGEVVEDPAGTVKIHTRAGVDRIVNIPSDERLLQVY